MYNGKAQGEPWLVLFSPAAEMRYRDGLMLTKQFNCGNSEICSDDCAIYICFSFFPHRAATRFGRTLSPRLANCSRNSGKSNRNKYEDSKYTRMLFMIG